MSARLVFETRAKFQDFVARYKDDGIPYEVDSPFCNVKTDIAVRQSKSQEDQEIGKQFAPLWKVLAGKLKKKSKEMTQVPSLSLRSTSVHKFSASRIAGTAWENQCSNLLHVGTDRCLRSLLLIFVSLVFLMKCCNGLSLKPASWLRTVRPMCDSRPFASLLFCRLAGRGPFCHGFPFRWALQFVLSLVRCLTSQDATPCCREDPLYDCGRPHDTLSYLFFTALWFRQSQSILMQVQQTNVID